MEQAWMHRKSQDRFPAGLIIRNNLQPGDIGGVIALHGVVYAREHGYDYSFEGSYVAATFVEFTDSYAPQNDRLWVAEHEEKIVGAIGIKGRSETDAQLRWWLVHPTYRGFGLGRALLEAAIAFCQQRPYQTIYLWTVNDLHAAIHLYKAVGFKKTDETTHANLWGRQITEERYDLNL
jgi:GNAT superfamily N-acetyltransferase